MNKDREKGRHELKYVCSEGDLRIIETKIRSICKTDAFADADSGYNIRSVYFDTYDDTFWKENESGVDNRKKYRIRIYNASDNVIKLECKKSLHGAKIKESCIITREQCESLLKRQFDIDCFEKQELLSIFLAEAKSRIYMPKVMVDYNRNAYTFPIGNVRITFDRNISSSSDFQHFFEPRIMKRPIMPTGKHILEVKYDEVLPVFLKDLVMCQSNSQRTSFSKYYLCRTYDMGQIIEYSTGDM